MTPENDTALSQECSRAILFANGECITCRAPEHAAPELMGFDTETQARSANRTPAGNSALPYLCDLWWMDNGCSHVALLVLVRYGIARGDVFDPDRSSYHDPVGYRVVSPAAAFSTPFWFIHRQRDVSLRSCGGGCSSNPVVGGFTLTDINRTPN